MKYLSPERLHVTQTAGITQLSPVNGRLYTLTHSDTTGTLFLTVSRAFVTDQLTSQRDEVLGEWKQAGQQLVLFLYVFVGNRQMGRQENARRANVFKKELPLALEAIRYGDRDFFRTYPFCDWCPIFIHFTSEYPELNRTEYYGTPYLYR
ncbi:staygreen family protein [Geobacillus thermoleovorans]|uniref:Staygreen protein domain-containing protein n=3 Tax=Geobacillus TaxID=129337 RepID=A0ABN4ND43_9BACL|nr:MULTISPECIES: staygreen family protein [Geobacillus]AMX82388.1 hypothetical protein GS3922_01065 [Geobacillus subterraneus]AOL35707.1 hypothetical protein BGM21_15085 [Geobacillus thermoleovorans]AUI37277.1 hypothetical protein CWI35_12805 [[Bacillus] caldolyticus]KZS26602.1 hypothetical protein A5418_05825 [Geobacillus subterraneus]MED4971662.1 staygreen family protein [Geobacillus thermoleovorans]